MTTLQELSIKELFEVRDAIAILEKHGFSQELLKYQVQEAINEFRDGDDR